MTLQTPHSDPSNSAVSRFEPGAQRFLAEMLADALAQGPHSVNDFLRHFPPHSLMLTLRDAPELRARILEYATGMRPTIGQRKSPRSAAEDLQIALDQHETSARDIVALLNPEQLAQCLDPVAAWVFLTESDDWSRETVEASEAVARGQKLARLIQSALDNGLLSARELLESLGIESMISLLPASSLVKGLCTSIARARTGKAYGERELLQDVPVSELVDHVPHPRLWNEVVIPRVAQRHGFVGGSQAVEDSGGLDHTTGASPLVPVLPASQDQDSATAPEREWSVPAAEETRLVGAEAAAPTGDAAPVAAAGCVASSSSAEAESNGTTGSDSAATPARPGHPPSGLRSRLAAITQRRSQPEAEQNSPAWPEDGAVHTRETQPEGAARAEVNSSGAAVQTGIETGSVAPPPPASADDDDEIELLDDASLVEISNDELVGPTEVTQDFDELLNGVFKSMNDNPAGNPARDQTGDQPGDGARSMRSETLVGTPPPAQSAVSGTLAESETTQPRPRRRRSVSRQGHRGRGVRARS